MGHSLLPEGLSLPRAPFMVYKGKGAVSPPLCPFSDPEPSINCPTPTPGQLCSDFSWAKSTRRKTYSLLFFCCPTRTSISYNIPHPSGQSNHRKPGVTPRPPAHPLPAPRHQKPSAFLPLVFLASPHPLSTTFMRPSMTSHVQTSLPASPLASFPQDRWFFICWAPNTALGSWSLYSSGRERQRTDHKGTHQGT